jgi:hypothetical protein
MGHTPPNPTRGRMESHILRGVAFLRTESDDAVGFVSKINLIFSDNLLG